MSCFGAFLDVGVGNGNSPHPFVIEIRKRLLNHVGGREFRIIIDREDDVSIRQSSSLIATNDEACRLLFSMETNVRKLFSNHFCRPIGGPIVENQDLWICRLFHCRLNSRSEFVLSVFRRN
jgi:hypothetical protein